MSNVKLDDGKYEIRLNDKTGAMTFYRNGEAWAGGQEAFEHAKLVSSMAYRILELEGAHAGLVEALKTIRDNPALKPYEINQLARLALRAGKIV